MRLAVMNVQQQFIERHKNSDFRHKDELFAGLSSGDCVIESSPDTSLPCKHFLRIYRIRAEHLQQYATPHAESLLADVLALCEELGRTPDEMCRLWNFSMPPYSDLAVFEGAESDRVLGCIFAVDKRFISPDKWESLWNGESGSV